MSSNSLASAAIDLGNSLTSSGAWHVSNLSFLGDEIKLASSLIGLAASILIISAVLWGVKRLKIEFKIRKVESLNLCFHKFKEDFDDFVLMYVGQVLKTEKLYTKRDEKINYQLQKESRISKACDSLNEFRQELFTCGIYFKKDQYKKLVELTLSFYETFSTLCSYYRGIDRKKSVKIREIYAAEIVKMREFEKVLEKV